MGLCAQDLETNVKRKKTKRTASRESKTPVLALLRGKKLAWEGPTEPQTEEKMRCPTQQK